MPDTGGHASHLSLAIGGLAMVAAMALSVLAHRRRHNHFNPPV
ncbi:LPXTG cell wall anchor domain-containing protein [Bifidobacterium adolescentis]